MTSVTRECVGVHPEADLFFAQVREDPELEIAGLSAYSGGRVVVVGSGGCTALSLLARGAQDVVVVDPNAAQLDLVELKNAAVRNLSLSDAAVAIGATPDPDLRRIELYEQLREHLSLEARRYWDRRQTVVVKGVLGAGRTEAAMRHAMRVFRVLVHDSETVDRMLTAPGLQEQTEFYSQVWNSRRWRAMFRVLFNRMTMNKTYDPVFFAQLGQVDFAGHFRATVERALTRLPVRDNYFLHYLHAGHYRDHPSALPPYLVEKPDPSSRLTFVHGTVEEYLATQSHGSISGFALSNICEWLDDSGIDSMFEAMSRTANPEGAGLCFRNFLGHNEIPDRWRERFVADAGRSAELFATDRSLVQRSFTVADIASAPIESEIL